MLDREDIAVYHLNVSAQDHGHPQHMVYLMLTVHVFDVNDNPPEFQHSVYRITVPENMAQGTSVTQILATDRDMGTLLKKCQVMLSICFYVIAK